jgi:hypothetical protein
LPGEINDKSVLDPGTSIVDEVVQDSIIVGDVLAEVKFANARCRKSISQFHSMITDPWVRL